MVGGQAIFVCLQSTCSGCASTPTPHPPPQAQTAPPPSPPLGAGSRHATQGWGTRGLCMIYPQHWFPKHPCTAPYAPPQPSACTARLTLSSLQY